MGRPFLILAHSAAVLCVLCAAYTFLSLLWPAVPAMLLPASGGVLLTVTVVAPGSGGTNDNGGGQNNNGGGGGGGNIALNTTPIVSVCGLRGDFNSDGKVNIDDFSILAYWYKRTLTPDAIAQCIDLNGDGRITLVDFSILAYYWNTKV